MRLATFDHPAEDRGAGVSVVDARSPTDHCARGPQTPEVDATKPHYVAFGHFNSVSFRQLVGEMYLRAFKEGVSIPHMNANDGENANLILVLNNQEFFYQVQKTLYNY